MGSCLDDFWKGLLTLEKYMALDEAEKENSIQVLCCAKIIVIIIIIIFVTVVVFRL